MKKQLSRYLVGNIWLVRKFIDMQNLHHHDILKCCLKPTNISVVIKKCFIGCIISDYSQENDNNDDARTVLSAQHQCVTANI